MASTSQRLSLVLNRTPPSTITYFGYKICETGPNIFLSIPKVQVNCQIKLIRYGGLIKPTECRRPLRSHSGDLAAQILQRNASLSTLSGITQADKVGVLSFDVIQGCNLTYRDLTLLANELLVRPQAAPSQPKGQPLRLPRFQPLLPSPAQSC